MRTFFYWFLVILSISTVIIVNLIFDFRLAVISEFFICLIVIILPSIIFTFLDKYFPKKWYSENNILFKERKIDKKIFEKIRIKKWKDNVPQFLKIKNISKTSDKIDCEYIEMFISETRRGEFIHLIDIIFGIIFALFLPLKFFFRYTLPILCFWIFFNMLSIWIQRFNRPRLKKALQRFKADNNNLKSKENFDDEVQLNTL